MAVVQQIQAGSILEAPIRAAQYVRMSTDHQDYSVQNQLAVIAAYAGSRNMAIVRTYPDEGRSGLRLDDRPALRDLLETVQLGKADFQEFAPGQQSTEQINKKKVSGKPKMGKGGRIHVRGNEAARMPGIAMVRQAQSGLGKQVRMSPRNS